MKILIVEDEHKIAASIKKGLELENFIADVAYDGVHGYDLASSETYEVIVLDLMLPGLGGLEICKKLRAGGIHTPILMLTAKGALEDKITGLNSGADDYLVKPFSFTELLARIRALTRRPRTSLTQQLSVCDLTLNTLTYEVKRAGKKIILSRKEFSVLEYLMRHPNKILAKDQIISSVWEYDADVLPNTVEVYIGYLRQKIDKAFRTLPPLIHTVRGFGYKVGESHV